MQAMIDFLQHLLSSNQFLQGGFVLGLLTWVGYTLKAWPLAVYSKLKYWATFQVYFDDGNEFYQTFSEWFNENHPQKFRNVEVRFFYNEAEVGRSQEPRPATLESEGGWSLRWLQYTDNNLLWYKGRPLWVRKERLKLDAARDKHLMFTNSYSVSGFFARQAIKDLCNELLERKIRSTKRSTLRVAIDAGGYFNWRDIDVVKDLDHIFFSGKQELVADLDRFLGQREFYLSHGINYKRSYLFFGPPGTGKTSIASAIAKRLDYALYVINLAGLESDKDLQNFGALISRKSVVLLEDIDCVLSDREVKAEKLNFATILNFLDGLYAPSDVVIVLTTNHPEKLDEALTRKGRVDLALEVGYPAIADITAFMRDFYDREMRFDIKPTMLVGVGMAEIQDICLKNDLETAQIIVESLFDKTPIMIQAAYRK